MDDRQSALLVTTLGAFLIPLMGSSLNIALPSIGKEFEMSAVVLTWVTTSYLLTVAIFLIPMGRISDIYGRRRVFLLGFSIYTVSCLFCALAASPLLLISFRFFSGIGASMTFSTGAAILTSIYPPGERGKVLGINVAAVYAGLSCGPFLGGLLTYMFGWRSIFLIHVPLGLLIILVTLSKLKGEWREARGERFDLTGSVLSGFALVAIMSGFSRLPGIEGVALVLLGFFAVFLFIKWEERATSPIFQMDLFRKNKIFALSNLAALISYSATFAVSFMMSLYLQILRGFNPGEAGLILVFQPVMQAIFSPVAGTLSDRIEPRLVASLGMGLTSVGLFLLTFLTQGTAMPFIIGTLLLLGLGFALFSSPNTNAVMSSVEKKFYGVASATLGTMRSTGMMFSMGIVTVIFAIYIGQTQLEPSHHHLFLKSFKIAFRVFTALCIAGIFASLSRGRVREEKR